MADRGGHGAVTRLWPALAEEPSRIPIFIPHPPNFKRELEFDEKNFAFAARSISWMLSSGDFSRIVFIRASSMSRPARKNAIRSNGSSSLSGHSAVSIRQPDGLRLIAALRRAEVALPMRFTAEYRSKLGDY